MFDKLDLGCGAIKPPGFIGVDKSSYNYPKGEFVRCDVNKRLPFNNNSFAVIQAMQLIEHIDNNRKVDFIKEIFRLLKNKGLFVAEFPPVVSKDKSCNLAFYNDPTHTAWWTCSSFDYFCTSFRAVKNRDMYEDGYGIKTIFEKGNCYWITNNNYHVELVKI